MRDFNTTLLLLALLFMLSGFAEGSPIFGKKGTKPSVDDKTMLDELHPLTNQMKFDLGSARRVLKYHNPAMRNRNYFYQKDHPSDYQKWDYRELVRPSHS
jgi:hypothetical protein